MRFYERSDYPLLTSWYEAHGKPVPDSGGFPKCGIIVDNIAAGFLVQTDTPYALIDFFIANPAATTSRRSKALDILVLTLERLAREKGYKGIWCNTRLDAIGARALRLQYQEHDMYRIFSKEL